jgi:hypothetical protein
MGGTALGGAMDFTTHLRYPVLILLSLMTLAAAEYRFSLNGKPFEPTIIPLGRGVHPAAGDLISLYGAYVMLDGPGQYAFTSANDRLMWSFDGGETAPAQIELRSHSTDEKDADGSQRFQFTDPLIGMTRAQRGRIRHLEFSSLYDVSRPDLSASLDGIDWPRVVVSIRSDDWTTDGLAWLPESIRHLIIDPSVTPSDITFAAVRRFTDLHYLEVSGLGKGLGIDLGAIAGCTKLYRLELSGVQVAPPAKLPSLPSLGWLRLAHIRAAGRQSWPMTLDQLAGASQVEHLEISGGGLTSLADLGWTHVRTVICEGMKVVALPATAGPELRRIDLFGAPVPDIELVRFRSQHPAVVLRVQWRDAFEDLASCDRILLRTGGTCHRDRSQEQVLWSSDDRQQVQSFLATLDFDDRNSGHHCMCCGSATVELYRAGGVVASFGMHHGLSVRWSGGPWPGDAALSSASRDLVADWLKERGDKGTPAELRAHKEREAAHERHAQHWRQVLGSTVIEDLWASTSLEEARKVVVARLPAGDDRAITMLRLSAGAYPSWRLVTVFDQLLGTNEHPEQLLETGEIDRLLTDLPEDALVRDGLCRQVFGWRRLRDADPAKASVTGPRLAQHGLGDPREENRMDVIHTLAEVDAPWCRQVLREALVPKAARPLPPEAIATSSGQQSFLPRKVEIPDGCSVPAGAALALLFLRDEASLPVIKAMVDTLPEPDRGVVAGRLTEFQRQPPAP